MRCGLFLALALLAAPAAGAAQVTFACVGDYGSAGPMAADIARLVKSWRPAFILTVGDNNYPSGTAATLDDNVGRYYHEFIHPYTGRHGRGARTNRFFPSLGNHDWIAPAAAPYLDYFTLPGNERYYTFTNGPVQLFCLDSDPHEPDGNTAASAQAAWLRRALAESVAPWRLVYFHHAPFSSGEFHGTWTGETAFMRWPFKEWGASAVLAGHDHIYERVFTNGLVWIVNGLGGHSRDPVRLPLTAGSQRHYTAEYGALRLDATESNLVFRFINRHGFVADAFTLGAPASGTREGTGTAGGLSR
jgi:hypothetical protein